MMIMTLNLVIIVSLVCVIVMLVKTLKRTQALLALRWRHTPSQINLTQPPSAAQGRVLHELGLSWYPYCDGSEVKVRCYSVNDIPNDATYYHNKLDELAALNVRHCMGQLSEAEERQLQELRQWHQRLALTDC